MKKQKCIELASKLEFKSFCVQPKANLLFTIQDCEHELHWLRQFSLSRNQGAEVCACVCVCVRGGEETEKERDGETYWLTV